MYGLIGQIIATPGHREMLANMLIEATTSMPGCRSYVIALDSTNPDAIWVTEVWDSAEAHKASLMLPEVQKAIATARPYIAGFGTRHETTPLAGW
jgi:quinol monooxygenase YgiN